MDDPKAFPLHKKHSQAQIFKPLRQGRAAVHKTSKKKKREREQIVTFISMRLLKTQTLGDLEGTLHRKGIYLLTSYPNDPMEKPQSAKHTGPGRAKGVDPSGS